MIANSITNEYTEHVLVKEILAKVHEISQRYNKVEREFATGKREEKNPSAFKLVRSSIVSSRAQNIRGHSCISISPERPTEVSTFHQIEQRRHTLKKPEWKNSFTLSPQRKNRSPPSSSNLLKFRDVQEPQTLKVERVSPQTSLLKQFEHGSSLAINSIPVHPCPLTQNADILSNIKEVDSSLNFKDSSFQREQKAETGVESSPFCCLEELNLLTLRKDEGTGILKSGQEVFKLQSQKIQNREMDAPFVQRVNAEKRKLKNYILSKANIPKKRSAEQRLEQFKKNAKITSHTLQNPVLSFKRHKPPPSVASMQGGALTDRIHFDYRNESGFQSERTQENRPPHLSKMPSMSSMKSTRVDTDCFSHQASSKNRLSSRPQSSNSYRVQAGFSEIMKNREISKSSFREKSTDQIKRARGKSKSVCKLKPYLEEALKPVSLPFLASRNQRNPGAETERTHLRQNTMLSTFNHFQTRALPQLMPRKHERLLSRRQALDTLDAKM